MEHISDSEMANDAAAGVRAVMQSYGVECEVLPAGDRVVLHIPLSGARDLVTAARMRGQNIRIPNPKQLRLFGEDFAPTYAYA